MSRCEGMGVAWAIVVCTAAGCFGGGGGSDGGGSEPADASPSSPRQGDGGEPAVVECGAVGRSVACVGPGGCAGGQTCQSDGAFDACDCGAPVDVEAPVDGGTPAPDAAVVPPEPAVEPPACGVGAACTTASDCPAGFSCIEEIEAVLPASGLPGGGTAIQTSVFPGGVCSPGPLAAYGAVGACDFLQPPGLDGCGGCGRCGAETFQSGVVVACLEGCEPSTTSTGCSRPGYTCDRTTRTCVRGCASDVECRIDAVDTNGDGVNDANRYDPSSEARCDAMTLRCTTEGMPGAEAGDPCDGDGDCESDGFCWTSDRAFSGNPYVGGYCSKDGCTAEGFECAGGGTCLPLRHWEAVPIFGSACQQACTPGAEDPALQLGAGGHGDTCRDGYMCVWDGSAGTSGFCAPGNYNAVSTSNVGRACSDDDECYSPRGHGQCLLVSNSFAMCSVMDCGAPGMPADVCGATGLCVALDATRSACLTQCNDASDCPASLGCAAVSASVPTSNGVCLPCVADVECSAGQTCSAQGLCL